VKESSPQLAGLSFSSLAELFDAAQPQTNGEKALVAGYWIQIVQGAEELTAHAIHSELKNLGHAVSNITLALDQLKKRKPALVHQIRKSGKAQQARKTYKITKEGVKAVEAMLRRET